MHRYHLALDVYGQGNESNGALYIVLLSFTFWVGLRIHRNNPSGGPTTPSDVQLRCYQHQILPKQSSHMTTQSNPFG